MGLKDLTAKLAVTAVKTAGDLSVSVTYTSKSGTSSYDPATDTNTTTPNTVATFVAVLSTESENEYDYAKSNDNHLKMIVPSLSIPFEPSVGDSCVIRGRNYEVKRLGHVPGDAIYKIYVQQT